MLCTGSTPLTHYIMVMVEGSNTAYEIQDCANATLKIVSNDIRSLELKLFIYC